MKADEIDRELRKMSKLTLKMRLSARREWFLEEDRAYRMGIAAMMTGAATLSIAFGFFLSVLNASLPVRIGLTILQATFWIGTAAFLSFCCYNEEKP